MTRDDFALLENFTYREVERTGAKIKGVKFQTMWTLQLVRTRIKKRIRLMANGLNSGKHKSKEHPDGEAVDFAVAAIKTFAQVMTVIYYMLEAGFKGIGVYWNGVAYSFHGDIGRRRMWATIKVKSKTNPRVKVWEYHRLLVDPRTIRKAA